MANKYRPQIIENKLLPLATETDREDILSSRRESKQFPQFFRTEVINFGNGDEEENKSLTATHVPIIIPIFEPRESSRVSTKPKEKKRKFTAVEEEKTIIQDKSLLNTERAYSVLDTNQCNVESMDGLFEEFLIIGVDEELVEKSSESLQSELEAVCIHPTNIFQYPNLAQHKDW